MLHHGMEELHTVGIATPLVRANDHASKTVCSGANVAHASVVPHADDSCLFWRLLWEQPREPGRCSRSPRALRAVSCTWPRWRRARLRLRKLPLTHANCLREDSAGFRFAIRTRVISTPDCFVVKTFGGLALAGSGRCCAVLILIWNWAKLSDADSELVLGRDRTQSR